MPLTVITSKYRTETIRIFSVFTHLIKEINAMCFAVRFFSFLPQIWTIQKQYLMIKQQI
jgi:hypothetical protein